MALAGYKMVGGMNIPDPSYGQPGSSTWWPESESGAQFPSYTEFTKGIPNLKDQLQGMGYGSLLNDPGYGRVPEAEISRWWNEISPNEVRKGMGQQASRYADSGYAPQYNLMNARGDIERDLAAKGAGYQMENLFRGQSAKNSLYKQYLGSMANQQGDLNRAYVNYLGQSMSQKFKQAGQDQAGYGVQQPGMGGKYNQGGVQWTPLQQAWGQGGYPASTTPANQAKPTIPQLPTPSQPSQSGEGSMPTQATPAQTSPNYNTTPYEESPLSYNYAPFEDEGYGSVWGGNR